MKLQFLEQRVEETYHIELLFKDLKEDYESVRKDRAMAIENYERRQMILENDNGDLRRNLHGLEKTILSLKESMSCLEEKLDLNNDLLSSTEKKYDVLKNERDLLSASLDDKRHKIDHYVAEIHLINRKVMDFNMLVDGLVQENKRLTIVVNEYEKKDLFLSRQGVELQRLKSASGIIPTNSSSKIYK